MNRLVVVGVALVLAVVVGSRVTRGAGESAEPLVGCGGPVEALPRVRGLALLGGPLADATVTLQDPAGHELFKPAAVDWSNGVFEFDLPTPLAAPFRVIITGGTHLGQPFTDTLRLDVESFTPGMTVLYVNGPSTLLSVHRVRHPAMSFEDAARATRAMLGISEGSDLGFDLQHQPHFSHEAFFAAAQRSGAASLQAWLERLSTDFDAGLKSHALDADAGQQAKRTQAGGLLGRLMKDLQQEPDAAAFGWVFQTDFTVEDQRGFERVVRELIGLVGEVADAGRRVQALSARPDLNGFVQPMMTSVLFIKRHLELLGLALAQCNRPAAGRACSAATFELHLAAIADPDTGVEPHLARLHTLLVGEGTGGSIGLLQALSRSESPGANFGRPAPIIGNAADFAVAWQLVGAKLLSIGRRADSKAPLRVLRERLELQRNTLREVMKRHPAAVGTVLHHKTKLVALQAPFSNLDVTTGSFQLERLRDKNRPFIYTGSMWAPASHACSSLNESRFGDATNWRLPTKAELVALVEGAPREDTIDGGVYAWLEREGGFTYRRDVEANWRQPVRGFVSGPPLPFVPARQSPIIRSAYLASEGEGLMNDGVGSVCWILMAETLPLDPTAPNDVPKPDFTKLTYVCGSRDEWHPPPNPKSYGAWCVHDPDSQR